jgi:predicted O-methyltransferase YrrM
LTVHRKLVLPEAASAAPSAEYAAANAEAVLTVCAEASAELLLAGDLTGLDAGLLAQVTARGVSVLHAPADIVSGVAQLAKDRRYHLLAAGEWAGERWKNTRTDFASLRTLTPGFRLARHYRLLLPDLATLRLAVVVRFSAPEALQTVVNCLAELRRRHVDFQAEIVSLDNPSVADQAVLAKRLKEAGLAGQADYTGVWDALREETLLARSNVLVTATGEAECFPWRQLRAMAGGLVVVSENLGGTAGVVRSGEDGWLYAPGDEAALTAHLLALIKDAPAWVRLQRAAQARASEFSAPAVGLRLENLATQLLEQAVEPNVLRPASTAGIGAFLARYQREIGGVTELADVSMLALTGLCALQNEVGDRGDMMETGVFRAGTASLLASFLKPEERIFLVDPYQNVENNRRTILGFSGVTNAQLHFHTLDSVRANKRREQVFGAAGPDLRLVHIDGEHSYDAVFSDLDMATHFLAPGGLIVLDDIFALDSACCTHAMFDYLRQNPTVHCVAMGYRKAYLCESRHLLKYRRFFLNLPELASTVLGANVRVCFNDFGLERGYLTFSDCRKGEPRYQVIGKRFYQLREAAAAMGIAW